MATDVVPATDRGLAYGDGVFRTLAVRAGRPVHWQRQYAKLAADCERLRLACPPSTDLRDEVEAAAAEGNAAVKIIVTRGEGERGYRMPRQPRPNCIVIGSPLPVYPDTFASGGVRACVCRTALGTQTALAGIKHLNRLENVLARSEWDGEEYAEGLMCDEAGLAICGTMSNVFIVERGRLCTPGLRRCGVAGLTRDLVLEAAAREGAACSIEDISLERVTKADEVFFVNSLIGVWPVRALGDTTFRHAALAPTVRTWLRESHADA